MTTNLNLDLMAANQSSPEVTFNNVAGEIDAAITATLAIDLTNSVVLTNAQYRSAIYFTVSPVGATKTLTLPAIARLVMIANATATAFTLAVGSTTVSLTANSTWLVVTDGTANGITTQNLAASGGGGGGGGGAGPAGPPGPDGDDAEPWIVSQVVQPQTFTFGFSFVAYGAGTISTGTYTPNPINGNYQYYTNGGAHTLGNPSIDCAVDILVKNNASAGAITFTTFTVGASTGDALDTTNNHQFIISIRRINGVSTYIVKALQ